MPKLIQRRPDLLLRPLGNDGQHVVKDPVSGTYYEFPAQETYLLQQLDGVQTPEAVCQAFEKQFGEGLTTEDLDQFIEMVEQRNLVVRIDPSAPPQPAPEAQPFPVQPVTAVKSFFARFKPLTFLQDILYVRKNVFDPDRLFNRLAPRLSWIWTATFFWISLSVICLAAILQWSHWSEFAAYVPETIRWENVVLAWFILFVVTTLHEFAHGLTCKHYGGEVHEIGFMLMFFMPCFYCNVSDAWLLKEKSKRIWVTLAGGYCDLCMWAVAVVFWRLTLPDTFPNHLAWWVLTICGGRFFFNFNPLIKLDGYYMVSDWWEIPNLRQRSLDYVSAHLRWLLWGAPRPERRARGGLLLGFGVTSWLFTLFYITLFFYALHHLALGRYGMAGFGVLAFMAYWILPSTLAGLTGGEVVNMLKFRWTRTVVWLLILVGVGVAAFFYPMRETVTGTFKTRATVRAEVRAPVTGFLRVIHYSEGSHVEAGAALAYIEIPDLASKLAQKTAEEKEVQARLKLLMAGARHEEVTEQRNKVQRADAWCVLAKKDLTRKQEALKQELERMEQQIGFAMTQVEFARNGLERAQKLLDKKALSTDHFLESQRQYAQAQTHLAQASSQKRERLVLGSLEAESELARREKDAADAKAALRLLEAGSRPEDIEAEKSRLARIQEEKGYFESLSSKLRIASPITGVVLTPHIKEKVGQYLKEGDLICEMEDPKSMEIEAMLEEQDIHRIQPGFTVALKPRSCPLQTLTAKVKYIAPQAVAGKVQSTVTVYCQLDNPADLITGMTGYARVWCGQGSPANNLGARFVRYLRTEVWW